FLHRKVNRVTLKNLAEDFRGFVKPVKLKLFDGMVIQSSKDLEGLTTYSEGTEVYVSDVVQFLTEWRYYVVDGELAAWGNYLGDENVTPDIHVVKHAVESLKGIYRNYCLDFGVLD